MKPVVCFLPCCSRKEATGNLINASTALSERELPKTFHLLEKGRQKIKDIASQTDSKISFKQDSPLTSALFLYKGAFYQQLNKRGIIGEIQNNRLRLFILSAVYGIVDAFEPLQYYDAELKGKVAKHWKEYELEEIICELLLTLEPKYVFGFFAGSEAWSDPGAKYRYFFVEGLYKAIGKDLNAELSGCFFRQSGLGTTQILGSLGRTFMDLLRGDFSESIVSRIAFNSRLYGTTEISFKRK